jgi:pantoate--beta-alanine ligase
MTIRVVTHGRDLPAAPDRSRSAVVMTMGALHEGHAALIRRARDEVGAGGVVTVSVFVNPAQFGAGEDFDRYPRTFDDDLRVCEAAGADTVFAPDVAEVYGNPAGLRADSVTVDPGPLAGVLEGAARPGHFRGVLTVVAKLLGLTRPDVALYGEKDYQQLVLIRRMVEDLSMPLTVVGVPTVREPDGLALSSRNRFLAPRQRLSAVAVPRALEMVAAAVGTGVGPALEAGRTWIDEQPGIDLDYLVVTDPDLGPAPASGPARALIAVRVGSTRLIDNLPCTVGP